MRVDLFDFHLPDERIATEPATPRESARLMHLATDTIQHHSIGDMPDLLQPGDVLIFNDSRVIPARFFSSDGVEILLHQRLQNGCWRVFARPARKLKQGATIRFPDGLSAEMLGREADGQCLLNFNKHGAEWLSWLQRNGQMPLPPYIQKKRAYNTSDISNYQTIYARESGSVAAPTAGLHFTPELMQRLTERGVEQHYVTLHVGAGTFQPVKVEDTSEHQMHEEYYEVPPPTAKAIHKARGEGRRIIAVGTTSLRTLESATDESGNIIAQTGNTRLFITPGYRFKLVDGLITNFHLPKSTLLMLVAAFAGFDTIQRAYATAISMGYRFYSYGDACLIERNHHAQL